MSKTKKPKAEKGSDIEEEEVVEKQMRRYNRNSQGHLKIFSNRNHKSPS